MNEKLTFEQIEDCFPESPTGGTTEDGYIKVSAQWLHEFAIKAAVKALAAAPQPSQPPILPDREDYIKRLEAENKEMRIRLNIATTVEESNAILDKIVADHSGDFAEKVEERALFEALESESELSRDDEEGDYLNPCVQSAWEGFLAGRKSALGIEPVKKACLHNLTTVAKTGDEIPVETCSYCGVNRLLHHAWPDGSGNFSEKVEEKTWIEWGGGEPPDLPSGKVVEIKFRDGSIIEDDDPKDWGWEHQYGSADIIAYRLS